MNEHQEHLGRALSETLTMDHVGVARIVTSQRPASDARPPRATRRPRPAMAASSLLLVAIGIHVIAASLIYFRLVHELYALLEDTPRLLVLERGLVRLLAVSVYMPPFAPTVLLSATTFWVGAARREPNVAHTLSYGALAIASDSLLRLLGTWLAQPVATVGEVLDLPVRYSPGPRMVAALLGHEVTGSTVLYWSVVCSFAAAIVVWCVARSLLGAEWWRLDPVERRRRVARGNSIVTAQCAFVSVAAFFAIAFVGLLALPPATQLFLQTFG